MSTTQEVNQTAIQAAVAEWPHRNAINTIRATLRGLDSVPAWRIQFAALRAGLLQAIDDQEAADITTGDDN